MKREGGIVATTTLYRSARASEPHIGRGSFWTTNKKNADWFRQWEGRTFGHAVGPSAIYRTEVDDDQETVNDLRPPWPIKALMVDPNVVLNNLDHYAGSGIDWLIIYEGPIEQSFWTVYIRVSGPVETVEVVDP